MRRFSLAAGWLALAVGVFLPGTSHAQQSLNFTFGAFLPNGQDARTREEFLQLAHGSR